MPHITPELRRDILNHLRFLSELDLVVSGDPKYRKSLQSTIDGLLDT